MINKLLKILPNVEIRRVDTPDVICGIYLLLDAGEVVYVGQSVNIESRVAKHIIERKKVFDSYAIHRCIADDLNALELTLIKQFNPRYNVSFPTASGYISIIGIKRNIIGSGCTASGGFGPARIRKVLEKARLRPAFVAGTLRYRVNEVRRVFTKEMIAALKGGHQ